MKSDVETHKTNFHEFLLIFTIFPKKSISKISPAPGRHLQKNLKLRNEKTEPENRQRIKESQIKWKT